jgi:hypothetical protein
LTNKTMKNAPCRGCCCTLLLVSLMTSKSVAARYALRFPLLLEFSIHNARCLTSSVIASFRETGVLLALQIQELKLRAEEQEHHHFWLAGIILPKRAARIETVPSLVSGLRHRERRSSIDTSPGGLSDLDTPSLTSTHTNRQVAGVFDFSAVGLQGYGPTNEGNFKPPVDTLAS